ncbi:MAG: hypothetical protein UY89_C0013G0015 [Parcubacteria group bacterium GW2011_GWA1_54_9]|nr:MAG: hypothetical protein UY89_C0013G0015 [Parcubacteria group bacterium GW2011_GWA1_54_9]KKW41792.1 MAG: hypothetical protein UY91_C0011G0016 [Parcubacteria group bacterium GW2011_GWB1_55_9]
MSIADIGEKCKNFLARVSRDALILAIIVLTALFGFGLGYLAGLDSVTI